MKKIVLITCLLLVASTVLFVAGCSKKAAKPLVMVWYPNESGEDLKGARDAIGALITEATGRAVEHKLTTDYTISIESIANNNADLGFFGAVGYIEANNRNKKVLPLVVNSGPSGTLSDALYYSWLAVKNGNEAEYKDGNDFSIDKIVGKKFSWVSTSSTSGFRVPSAGIVTHFSKKAEYANLKADDLLEGGTNKFFSEVLYGNSHQGAAVNLLTSKADIASFCDTCLANYVEFVSGTANRAGAVYQVRKDASAPFTGLVGEKFALIKSVPVLNAPFVVNSASLTAEEISKLRTIFTSDAAAKNENIFIPKGAAHKGLFRAGERFVAVEDAWFQPIRDLSK